MLASLQQFAQEVQECGGLQQIGTVAGLVQICGGAENVDANLGLLREVTELAQGPKNLADSLTGTRLSIFLHKIAETTLSRTFAPWLGSHPCTAETAFAWGSSAMPARPSKLRPIEALDVKRIPPLFEA